MGNDVGEVAQAVTVDPEVDAGAVQTEGKVARR